MKIAGNGKTPMCANKNREEGPDITGIIREIALLYFVSVAERKHNNYYTQEEMK